MIARLGRAIAENGRVERQVDGAVLFHAPARPLIVPGPGPPLGGGDEHLNQAVLTLSQPYRQQGSTASACPLRRG
jgi:hypothetical protein